MTDTDTMISDDFRLRVEEAIKALRSKGERISNRNVRREMGGGSPNWIAQVLRERPEPPPAEAIEPSAEVSAANILIPGLIEKIRGECAAIHERETAALRVQLEEARATILDQAEVLDTISFEYQTVIAERDHLNDELRQAHDHGSRLMALAESMSALKDQVDGGNEALKKLAGDGQEAMTLLGRELTAQMKGVQEAAENRLHELQEAMPRMLAESNAQTIEAIAVQRQCSHEDATAITASMAVIAKELRKHDQLTKMQIARLIQQFN